MTHSFEAVAAGEPYTAIVQVVGHRLGVPGKPTNRDVFSKQEEITNIVPGSGRLSVTTWAYDLEPGEWAVSAELTSTGGGAATLPNRGRHGPVATLPRTAWSWLRWAVRPGAFAPITTRWAPLVRLTAIPAVIHGSWPALLSLGILIGVVVQASLLTGAGISLGDVLLVDLIAGMSGLLGSWLWYLALRRGGGIRPSLGGLSVDGFLVTAPVVGIVTVLALSLPLGLFLDATAPAIFFGVAIGRLGCFFTGCCAGRFTASRWGVWSSDRRVGGRRIPTQLMESAGGLLLGLATLWLILSSAAPIDGTVFVGAMAVYVLLRQSFLRLRATQRANSLAARLAAVAAVVVLAIDIVKLLRGPG